MISNKKHLRPTISRAHWSAIRLFAMDVDGVLTDGTVQISSEGTETKSFSVLDGMGLVRLRKAGLTIAWISGRASGATTVRAAELKVPHVIQGRTDKLAVLQELAAQMKLEAAQCAYMGRRHRCPGAGVGRHRHQCARRHAGGARRRRLRHAAPGRPGRGA